MSRPQAVQPEVRSSAAPSEGAPAAKVSMHLSELKQLHVTQLVEMAIAAGIENASRLRKQDLIFAML